MTDETEQVNAVPSPGQLLSQARQGLGLSDAQIAERMNLKLTVIQALESDDFDSLPNAIFVRGYLKSYAKLVSVEEEIVLKAYELQGGKELDTLDMQSFSRRTSRERSNSRIMWITYAIVLFSLSLVVIWWWQKYQTEIEVIEVTEPAVTMQDATPDEQLPPNEELATAGAVEPEVLTPKLEPEIMAPAPDSSLSVAESSQDDEPVQQAVEESVVPVAPAIQPEGNVVEAQVALTFAEDCWIRVEDATGNVVAEGVKTPARVVRFSGQPPFKAIFGLPAAVTVEYEGEPMSFDVKDPKRPLRLTIPKTE